MKQENLKLLGDVNRAIIKFRGAYSMWSSKHSISYNEMLVQEYGQALHQAVDESR